MPLLFEVLEWLTQRLLSQAMSLNLIPLETNEEVAAAPFESHRE